CLLGSFNGIAGSNWRFCIMRYRLCYSVEKQPDPHSRTEKHGKPGTGREVRCGILPSQPDGSIFTKSQKDAKNDKGIHRQYEKPAYFVSHKTFHCPEQNHHRLSNDNSDCHKYYQQNDSWKKYWIVDIYVLIFHGLKIKSV